MVSFEQLRIFIAVAELEHMTRAAESLGLTQSAASSAVAAIEQRYATPLFDRIGRRIALTDAGKLFLDEAKAVLARAAAAERLLEDMSDLKRGTIILRASQTIAGYWLPKYLAQFRAAYPHVMIQVGIGNTAQVVKAVMEGAADLGFIEGSVHEESLAYETVAADRMVLIVGPSHPWKGRASVTPGELAETDWVLREPGSGTRSTFEMALARHGLSTRDLNVTLELPTNEAVKAAIKTGIGATVISELVVAQSLIAETLYGVGFDLPQRPFQLVRHRARSLSRAAAALVGIANPA